MVIVNVTRGSEVQVPIRYQVGGESIHEIKSNLIRAGVGDGYFYLYQHGEPEALPSYYYNMRIDSSTELYYGVYVTDDERLTGQISKAIEFGDLGLVKELVTQLSDINSLNDRRRDLLHIAIDRGDLSAIEYLLQQGVDVDSLSDRWPGTPLYRAVRSNNLPLIKVLIRYGADVNWKAANTGRTVLHFATQYSQPEIVSLLLDSGADINVVDNTDLTPLSTAIFHEDMEIFQLLLRRGADFQIPDNRPPLIVATEQGLINMVKYLLDYGADKYKRDQNGDTAEDIARRDYQFVIADYIHDYEPLMKEPEL